MIPKYRTDLVVDPIFEETGEPGRDGADGRDGVNGRDGADGAAGANGRGWTFRGEWSSSQQYSEGDVVTNEGSSYLCLKPHKNREPPGRQWAVVAMAGRDGEDGERGIASKGQKGDSGTSAVTDIEVLFEETAIAGQVMRSSGDDKCRITNALSYYTCTESFGLAVADTLAGRRGLVRTVGVISRKDWTALTGEEFLHPGATYSFNGFGGLSRNPCNYAMYIPIGVAIKRDTLLISPEQSGRYVNAGSDVKAPCLTTLPKGSPVYLATSDSVDAASMPANWWVAGVLMGDVAAGEEATYRIDATITRDDWSSLLESGDTLLEPNQAYYLSDVPGKYTTDSTNRLFLGKAKNTKSLRVTVGDSTPNYPLTV